MQKKGESDRGCTNYERQGRRATKHGNRISIIHKEGSRDDIDERWPEKVRDESGRVIEKR